MSIILIVMSILMLFVLAIGVIFIFYVNKKKKQGVIVEPDYRVFFILGITFLPMGLVFIFVIGPPFIGISTLGLCYLVIGLINRKKWKKQ